MSHSQCGYLEVFDPERRCWIAAYGTVACHLFTWRILEDSPFTRQPAKQPPPAEQVRTVHLDLPLLEADSTPLGLHVSGGKENNHPLFICKLSKGSVAESTGLLYAGDAILEVNGEDLRQATHYEAVEALRHAVASKSVQLCVQYRRDVTLQHNLTSADSSMSDTELQRPCIADVDHALPLEGCSLWQVAPHLPDSERCFQLNGPDGKAEACFRARSQATCQTWLNAVRGDIASSMEENVRAVNLLLAGNADIGQVKVLGWLQTQLREPGERVSEEWDLAFVAVSETQLLVYRTAPNSALQGPEFWTNPADRHELLQSR